MKRDICLVPTRSPAISSTYSIRVPVSDGSNLISMVNKKSGDAISITMQGYDGENPFDDISYGPNLITHSLASGSNVTDIQTYSGLFSNTIKITYTPTTSSILTHTLVLDDDTSFNGSAVTLSGVVNTVFSNSAGGTNSTTFNNDIIVKTFWIIATGTAGNRTFTLGSQLQASSKAIAPNTNGDLLDRETAVGAGTRIGVVSADAGSDNYVMTYVRLN